MGDYCAPARGTMEIMRPEGHIMPLDVYGLRQPSGGIMQPQGGIMFPEGLHNFHYNIGGLIIYSKSKILQFGLYARQNG